jgi:hypothetical protein
MMGYQFISIILIYIIIGLAWADFMHAMIIKSERETGWNHLRKTLVSIFWPISFLSFLIGLLTEIINITKR